jgi:hypothetical protein
MNDRPSAAELIAATRHFLEVELIPTLTDPRLRFQTLVATNVLSIAERELATEEEQLREEWQRLGELGESRDAMPERLAPLRQAVRRQQEQLCRQTRRGEFDEPARFRALCRLLRQNVERKLEVANPRYLAGFQPNRPGSV